MVRWGDAAFRLPPNYGTSSTTDGMELAQRQNMTRKGGGKYFSRGNQHSIRRDSNTRFVRQKRDRYDTLFLREGADSGAVRMRWVIRISVV